MAVINGTAVNFGFIGQNGITVNNINGWLLQSADHASHADVDKVRNAAGDEVVHAWHNFRDEATLEVIVTGTGISNAILNTALQTPGTLISISTCGSMPSLVASTWEIQSGFKISGSNVNAKKISVPIHKFAGITATASA